MEHLKKYVKRILQTVLGALAVCAQLTAQLGAGTASVWNQYQPELPKRFRR